MLSWTSALFLLPIAVQGRSLSLSNAFGFSKAVAPRDDCAQVHIFVFRGNDEPYPGRQGALTTAVCNLFSSCTVEHIEYDNPSAPGCDAFNDGPTMGISAITAYNKQCPNAKLVVTGYSQGGQIVGDVLGGGGGDFSGCTQKSNVGLDPNSAPGNQIAAVTLWGDGRHTANQSYNVEDGSAKNGNAPRSGSQLSSLNQFSSVLRSYCVITDPICAEGNDGNTHTTYFDIWSDDAAKWVASKIGNLPAVTVKSSASSTPTPTSSVAAQQAESTSSSSLQVQVQQVSSSSASSATSASSSVASSTVTSSRSSTYSPSYSDTASATATFVDMYPVLATGAPSAASTSSVSKSTVTLAATTTTQKAVVATTTTAKASASSTGAASALGPVKVVYSLISVVVVGAIAL